MQNTWKFYYNCKIIPEKNFKVDNLETYLGTLTTDTITAETQALAPMYIKHDLNLFLKIDKTQALLNFFSNANNLNYVSIQNKDDSSPVYYFVLHKTWTAKDTVSLILLMDTVNTFTAERNNFVISNRTLVNREHKDRLKREVNWKDVLTIINGVEYRLNPSPVGLNPLDYYCSIYNNDDVNKVIVRKYDENGTLTNEYAGTELGIAWIGADWWYQLQDTEGETVIRIKISEYLTQYNAGQYITVEMGQAFSYDGSEHKMLESKARDVRIVRLIDLYSEGLNPILYKSEVENIEGDNLNWYLVYKNQNTPTDSLDNPVDCFLCSDNAMSVKGITNVYEVAVADISDSDNRIYLQQDNANSKVYYSIDGTNFIPLNNPMPQTYGMYLNFYFVKSGAKFKIYWGIQNTIEANDTFSLVAPVEIDNIEKIKIVGGTELFKTSSSITKDTLISTIEAYTSIDITTAEYLVGILGINSVNKTDPKIIKIIKLPYCPTFYNSTSGSLGSGEWEYDSGNGMPKLIDLDTQFFNTISPSTNPLGPILNVSEDEIYLGIDRDDFFESKLYHSDYYLPKFVYDSFGFNFALERVSTDRDITNFKINFVATGTIHSHFLFEFENYECPTYASEDYYKVLNVARNNEITIYNQQFLNYLRAGYNYDVKSKQRTEAGTWIATTLSTVGAIASFASTPATGGMGTIAGISLATTAIGSFTSSIITTANAEANIEAKMAQLKQQATSVEGADDVDLMSYYTGNKAKFVLYRMSPKMQKAMADVFYYTGYIGGVMKLPNFNNRYWFNYVSCELQLEQVINIPDNCLEDLKNRYKIGITVMHSHEGNYDWNREKENWETNLV